MPAKARLESLQVKVRPFYENGDPSHDFAHVRRVMQNCELIARELKDDLRLEFLLAAALLHDIVNLPKNHPERTRASALAADRSRSLLAESGFGDAEIDAIGKIITEHSFSLGKAPSSVESAVLQDADKLDALGAIGIFRTVTCGARMGCAYYDDPEPFARTRPLDDRSYTLDHFFVKLLKLPELMNTEVAKREARRRGEFMRIFIDQLRGEIES